MTRYFLDNFDTGIFGRAVYKLQLDRSTSSKALRALLARPRPPAAMVACFAAFHRTTIEALEACGFSLTSIRTTLSWKNTKQLTVKSNLPSEMTLHRLTSGTMPQFTKAALKPLAAVIGQTSRYFHDSRLPKSSSLQLYQTWIHNSLYGGYADEAIILVAANKPVGLVTLKIKDRVGYIDLIGFTKPFQGKGLGTLLMAEALRFFKRKQIETIKVVTEGENISASAFYQKCGFVVEQVQLVYHWHRQGKRA